MWGTGVGYSMRSEVESTKDKFLRNPACAAAEAPISFVGCPNKLARTWNERVSASEKAQGAWDLLQLAYHGGAMDFLYGS